MKEHRFEAKEALELWDSIFDEYEELCDQEFDSLTEASKIINEFCIDTLRNIFVDYYMRKIIRKRDVNVQS